jgi:hypothetical protein
MKYSMTVKEKRDLLYRLNRGDRIGWYDCTWLLLTIFHVLIGFKILVYEKKF